MSEVNAGRAAIRRARVISNEFVQSNECEQQRLATVVLVRRVCRFRYDKPDQKHYWSVSTRYNNLGLICLVATCRVCGHEGEGPYVSTRHAGRRSYARMAWDVIRSGVLPCREEAVLRAVMLP